MGKDGGRFRNQAFPHDHLLGRRSKCIHAHMPEKNRRFLSVIRILVFSDAMTELL